MDDLGDRMSADPARVERRQRTRRVLVAGGRRLTRRGIAALLDGHAGTCVVGVAGDALSARSAVAAGGVDVVVTHAFLGDAGGGAALAVLLREESPETGVVLLLGDGDAGEVHRVLEEGTQRRALLLMDHPRCADDLPRAVGEVDDGGSVVHPGVVDLILAAQRRSTADHALDVLTPREWEVLRGISDGCSNQGIAARLGMSERAVEKHINQLYGKLELSVEAGTHRRVAAAVRYLEATGRMPGGAGTSPEVVYPPLAALR